MGGYMTRSERTYQTDSEALKASCGPVKGTLYRHADNLSVIGYLGIPYAKPPIGELRFKKPEPADPWDEVKDCTKYGPICPQTGGFGDFGEKNAIVSEANGLSLNVFAPNWKSVEFPTGRPVMIYIHGGGYELSSSADYHDYSVSGSLPLRDVVLVTINYRLGVLGFLTTGDDECRGNFGLWDQTLALKWVQKHIRSFGGNPDNVTVFGQSAGGSSTDLLSLSPHSRDLFHKFIPMAGTALCDFAIRTSENQANVFKEFAAHHGYTENNSASLLSWYQSQPTTVLCNLKKFKKSASGFLTFIPNLDGDFFPKPLDELRKEAPKKPMMTGVCEYEGLMLAMINPSSSPPQDQLKKQISGLLKEDVIGGEKAKKEVHQKIYGYYTKGVKEGDEAGMMKRLVEFIGDFSFNLGVLQTAKSSAFHGNDTYLYSFEFVNPTGFGMFQDMIPFPAATHCTELRYILGEGVYSKFDPDGEDLEMLEVMTRIFTNFAKYGNPGWQKYSLDAPETHYRLTFPESEYRHKYHGGRCEFLEEILKINKSYQKIVYGRDLDRPSSNI